MQMGVCARGGSACGLETRRDTPGASGRSYKRQEGSIGRSTKACVPLFSTWPSRPKVSLPSVNNNNLLPIAYLDFTPWARHGHGIASPPCPIHARAPCPRSPTPPLLSHPIHSFACLHITLTSRCLAFALPCCLMSVSESSRVCTPPGEDRTAEKKPILAAQSCTYALKPRPARGVRRCQVRPCDGASRLRGVHNTARLASSSCCCKLSFSTKVSHSILCKYALSSHNTARTCCPKRLLAMRRLGPIR